VVPFQSLEVLYVAAPPTSWMRYGVASSRTRHGQTASTFGPATSAEEETGEGRCSAEESGLKFAEGAPKLHPPAAV
jgi:hypothetical protein